MGPVPLAMAEAGAGGRPLVLVHGFTGAKEDFTEWLDPLAERGWHAIAFDQRGHGASHKPEEEGDYSFDAYAADLLAVLDAMGWASAVVLGHSMGGMVVQTAALQAPERFDAVVLMDTSHRAVRADPDIIELAVTIARDEGMAAVMAAQEMAGSADPVANEINARLQAERPDYKEFGQRKMLASSPAMYAAMLRSITDATPELDRLPALAGLTVPALVIVGEHDGPFVKPSERMAEAIPGATLAVIPGGAHSPQFEAPDAWWAALTAFLDSL
ncbi:MAG TPA: alpha/beta hydrolase [Acidimicrobiales bacterium]|nr:alpha/beta hydrolase [Acidimicrobiales bacterium]